jgi:hypothetical protein
MCGPDGGGVYECLGKKHEDRPAAVLLDAAVNDGVQKP